MNIIENLKICKLCVIVNFGLGSKVVHIANQNGVHGGTILTANGTFYNKVMEWLGLNQTRKEMVWMVAQEHTALATMQSLENTLKFNQKHTGIAFIEPLVEVQGVKNNKYIAQLSKEVTALQAIYTVVDRGKGHIVVEAASEAGARGATIFEGRGAGIHQAQKVFGIEIEPEKDIVLCIAPTQKVDAIMDAINHHLEIEKDGKGIIFVHPVSHSSGISSHE